MADDEETDDGGTETEPGETGPDTAHSDVKVGRLAEEEPTDDVDAASILNHVAYVAVAFAATGLGFGVLVFLISQFGADATVYPGQAPSTASFVTNFILTGLTVALYIPLFLAPLIGFVVDLSADDGATALTAAFFGTLLGSVLLYMLAGGLGDMQYQAVQTTGGALTPQFDVVAGAIDSVLVGIVGGLVAALSAAIGRYL